MTPKDLTTQIYSLLDELQNSLIRENVAFATEEDIENGADEFYDCPIQNEVSRHGHNITYYIYKIEGGVACGIDPETSDEESFRISELYSDCLLQIGSRIN